MIRLEVSHNQDGTFPRDECDCRRNHFKRLKPVDEGDGVWRSDVLRQSMLDKRDNAPALIGDYDKLLIFASNNMSAVVFNNLQVNVRRGFTHMCICHLRRIDAEIKPESIVFPTKLYAGAFQNLTRYPAHIPNTEICRLDNVIHSCENAPEGVTRVHSLKDLSYLAVMSAGFDQSDEHFAALYEWGIPETVLDDFPEERPHFLTISDESEWFKARHGGSNRALACQPDPANA